MTGVKGKSGGKRSNAGRKKAEALGKEKIVHGYVYLYPSEIEKAKRLFGSLTEAVRYANKKKRE